MALDAVTYGRVEEAEENILNNLNDVKSTVDTLPEKVEQKLDPVQTDMAQLVENVQKQVEELRTIVENSPAGILPPGVKSKSASSTESGINVTITPNLAINSSGNVVEATSDKGSQVITKGVMVRFSDQSFPKTIKEGNLAFIDEDIYTLGSGTYERRAKEITHLVTGLTNGKTYYFSIFPYSTYNVYNENTYGNTVSCQWTGTKGTLTVNVTQDYDYKPLGEYTATMTPTAGGQAITKTQRGAATVVFSGLEAGEYTLSFSDVTSFTKPKNQSVTVIAGKSQILDLQYKFTLPSLSQATWSQINEYSSIASNFWSVGDTKDVVVNGETLTFEIVGFNHDDLSDGSGKAGITFGMKNLMATTKRMNPKDTNNGSYASSELCAYVSGDFYNGLPSDLQAVIKSVKKVTGNGGKSGSWSGTRTDNFDTWLFSEQELLGKKHNSIGNEGSKYERFTSDSTRIKKLSNGSGSSEYWWLRSPLIGDKEAYCCIKSSGASSIYNAHYNSLGVCVGFCV